MGNVTPIDEEYFYEGSVIISQTDLNGVITFINRKFCEVSGYSKDEVLGLKTNIFAHPQMPKAVFKKMWENLKGGQTWNGIVKNLRKDGKYYWINLEILPIRDKNDNVTGYISVAKHAAEKNIKESEELYKKMLSSEV